MSGLDRNSKSRALVFESLEQKASPSASLMGVPWFSGVAAEVSGSTVRQTSAECFLQYVELLEPVSIQRSAPVPTSVSAVDHFLASTSPRSF